MSRRRFQTRGPAALKLRSPKLLCVRGTRHVLAAAECSWRRSLSVTSWMSSAMYAGVWPARDWCTKHATLYSTHWQTGSQCSWRSTGVMCHIVELLWPAVRRRSEWTEPSAKGRLTCRTAWRLACASLVEREEKGFEVAPIKDEDVVLHFLYDMLAYFRCWLYCFNVYMMRTKSVNVWFETLIHSAKFHGFSWKYNVACNL